MARTKTSRASNGDGSVYQSSGQWWAQITMPNGKPKRARAKTQREAKLKLKELRQNSESGVFDHIINGLGPTLEGYFQAWLKTHGQTDKEYKTVEGYRWVLERHVMPVLGRRQIDRITEQDVQRMIDALKLKDAAPKSTNPDKVTVEPRKLGRATITYAIRALHKLFEDAINLEPRVCSKNPVRTKQIAIGKSAQKKAPEFLSKESVFALRERGLAESPVREVVLFMLGTGTRTGEARGIRWGDLDLDHGRVTIRRQLQRQAGKGLVEKERTKGNAERTIDFPRSLARELQSRKLVEGIIDDNALVFTNPYGRPMDCKYLYNKLKEACKLAGINQIGPHSLRHTAATLMLGAGRPIHAVSKTLGHANISLTANLYGHAEPEASRANADVMEAIIYGDEQT